MGFGIPPGPFNGASKEGKLLVGQINGERAMSREKNDPN